jgi:hypothetical protein
MRFRPCELPPAVLTRTLPLRQSAGVVLAKVICGSFADEANPFLSANRKDLLWRVFSIAERWFEWGKR